VTQEAGSSSFIAACKEAQEENNVYTVAAKGWAGLEAADADRNLTE
jgi:hypothetical protein